LQKAAIDQYGVQDGRGRKGEGTTTLPSFGFSKGEQRVEGGGCEEGQREGSDERLQLKFDPAAKKKGGVSRSLSNPGSYNRFSWGGVNRHERLNMPVMGGTINDFPRAVRRR